MANSQSGSSAGGNNSSKIQSFLEALRASQNRDDGSKNFEKPQNNLFSEFQTKKEAERRRAEQFHQARQQEWNQLYSAKEKQKSRRIEEIREQLKKLAKQVQRLDLNIIRAIESPITEIGEYQENYLEHIRQAIHLFSLKVNSANSWLEMYQARSAKKGGHYWGMAKKHGTGYTQNNERNVATSVG